MMSLLSDVTTQLSLWGHKPSLWYLLSLIKNISSHFMFWNLHKDNKEGGGIVIIFIKLLFLFYFLFFFQFLDSRSQNITMHYFHQEVTFKQYFHLHQQFMFLFAYLSRFFFFFFFLCVCLDYSKTNEQIFIKNLWVEPDRRKKLLKDLDLIMDTKKSWIFRGPLFNVFLMTLAFYLIFLWRLTYMFGFILLSSLQYFISLKRLVIWNRAVCSLWVHLVWESKIISHAVQTLYHFFISKFNVKFF